METFLWAAFVFTLSALALMLAQLGDNPND